MSLFSSVLRLFGVGKLAAPDRGAQESGTASRGTEAGIVVSDERAMQIAAVWSCVRLLAETVAALPLGMYQTTSNGREPLDRLHPLAVLLRGRPNQMMTAHEFREAMTTQLALWGNAYARIERLGDRVVSITPLRPESVTPVRMGGELTYHIATEKGVEVLSRQTVFHLKGFGTSGTVGLSPLSHARQVMGLTVSADKFAGAAFANGGKPGGVLKVDKFLTPEQRELVRRLYTNLSAGADKAQGLWVLEGGMDFKEISIPPDDMQMLESRRFQTSEIARIFRVPSHLINDTEKSTTWGTGIEQLNLAFLQYTLQPYLTRWESTIRDALLNAPEREQIIIEHNVEGLLRADSQARALFYAHMAQNGLMTRNEIRRKENLPKMEGGDELTVQVNLAPVGAMPAPAAPAVRHDPPVLNVNIATPEISVTAPPVNVRMEPHIEVHPNRRGEVVREVVERDEYGVPSKVVEREIFRGET